MEEAKQSKKQLEIALTKEFTTGFRADNVKLRKDMCAQFSNYNEWIREYVVNAYDANATLVEIWGEETEDNITIFVKDNGNGMDREDIQSFFTLYKSTKENDERTVGIFGIGKLSVGAIPNQNRFEVVSSTGFECWTAIVEGSILEDHPIELKRIDPVPPCGTLFKISFEKKKSLARCLDDLKDICYRFTRFLDIETYIIYPRDENEVKQPEVSIIRSNWNQSRLHTAMNFNPILRGHNFEIILSLGPSSHEIYQKKVLVSDKYNLLCEDLEADSKFSIPNLCIRVNSHAFELPFGRHRLKNEEILSPLSGFIRGKALPKFFDRLVYLHKMRTEEEKGTDRRFLEMANALMIAMPDLESSWCNLNLIALYPGESVSLANLDSLVATHGKIYFADPSDEGTDYDHFDGPVVLSDQLVSCTSFLKKYFKREKIDLNTKDILIVAPEGTAPTLTGVEKQFRNRLDMNFAIKEYMKRSDTGDREVSSIMKIMTLDDVTENESLGKYKIMHTLDKIQWDVQYLVQGDGKTPCLTHKFFVKETRIILNLHHPAIRGLVQVSKDAPGLAAHWAVATALTEETNILKHLSSDTRENLVLLDALSKAASRVEIGYQKDNQVRQMRRNWQDLLDHFDFDISLN